MAFDHRRSAWTDAPRGCSDRFDWTAVRGVAIHWVGSSLSDDLRTGKVSAVVAFLRGARARNVADGYCDIEYNMAVAGDGAVWECRGLEHDGGANGTVAANDAYVSILVIYPVGGKPTEAQIKGVRRAIRMVREKGGGKEIRPHQHFVPTQCPGPAALQLIADGTFAPRDGAARRSRIQKIRDAIAAITARIRDLRKARQAKRDRIEKLKG